MSSCSVYWLRRNLIFHVAKNIFVFNNADELNDILTTNRYTEVDEDDEINELQLNV